MDTFDAIDPRAQAWATVDLPTTTTPAARELAQSVYRTGWQDGERHQLRIDAVAMEAMQEQNEVLRSLVYAWRITYGRGDDRGCRICSAAPGKPCSPTCLDVASADALAE